MFHVDEVLSRIGVNDRVLDVGGWACPFNRANWVLDMFPYETRGYYKTVGLPASQGGDVENFSPETWITTDICNHSPWPFPDKFFDYSICSHTLEDIRDPLFVCSELIRVSKRGYIETPSRLAETCRGWVSPTMAGLQHHRWLIEYSENRLDFFHKNHRLHSDNRYNLPPQIFHAMKPEEHVSWLFWEDSFAFAEQHVKGVDFLVSFVDSVLTSERFKGLDLTEADELGQLREELKATQWRLDAAEQRLSDTTDLGPIALGVARRIRTASRRFPRLASCVKPIARLAKNVVTPNSRGG